MVRHVRPPASLWEIYVKICGELSRLANKLGRPAGVVCSAVDCGIPAVKQLGRLTQRRERDEDISADA